MDINEITNNDMHEVQIIENIYLRIENANAQELEKIFNEMARHQPFLVSIMLGYKDDVSIAALNKLIHHFLAIWMYFKDRPHIRHVPLTKETYELVERRNVTSIVETITARQKSFSSFRDELFLVQSKILFAAITSRITGSPEMKALDQTTNSIILIAIHSVIDALDRIVENQK